MTVPDDRYAESYEHFRWSIPHTFNIAAACVGRWAASHPDRPALIRHDAGGSLSPTSFADLEDQSNRLAAVLGTRGIGRGDRVAILLPQSVETVAAHMAVYKLGAIAVPLAALFGSDALAYRLTASGAKAIVTDGAGVAKLDAVEVELPSVAHILCTDGAANGAEDYHRALADPGPPITTAETRPDDPAMMIFTSGTTGQPKGTLHGHRVLIGHLPGIAFSHHGFPADDDRFWTPSDWAWAGGLLNALLPSLFHGIPVVFGQAGKFDPDRALALIAHAGVRNLFLPPTAIRLLQSAPDAMVGFDNRIRTIASAGESLGREAFAWVEAQLGLQVSEFYGLTECNYVLGSSAAAGVMRAGKLGKPIPGHRVALVDDDAGPVAPGEQGQIALHASDPSMFLQYWNDPEGTTARFKGDWFMTGDMAVADADGFVTFVGRNDDLIISSGYRIGPVEIEDCLQAHPAVAMAAVIGKPDRIRNEIVKAYVTLRDGITVTPTLADEIQDHVRTSLSAAEYPREISFVDDIPLTTSGKIIRRRFRDRAQAEADID